MLNYMLKNLSGSEGQYMLDGEYHTLTSGNKVLLKKKPDNYTSNISVSCFEEITGETEILHKKSIKGEK